MSDNVKINGGTIEKWNIDLDTQLRKFKREFGIEFLKRVKQRTPVKTGALQRGYLQTQRKTSIDISNTKDYAAYVEFGTEKMAPRAMIRTTLEESEQIKDIAAEKAGLKK